MFVAATLTIAKIWEQSESIHKHSIGNTVTSIVITPDGAQRALGIPKGPSVKHTAV